MESIHMTKDHMLVLYGFLARVDADASLKFEDQAEQRVLWDLESELEAKLESVLSPNYRQELAEARDRVRDVSE